MEEIKVGDYVRTRYGQIILVDWLGNAIITDKEGVTVLTVDGSITKHSPNILDLIEVGDVLEIQEKDGEIAYLGLKQDTTTMTYKALIEDIKNKEVKLLGIVTKEQFNSIKYVIGE